MKKLKKKAKRKLELLIIVTIAVLSIFLWNTVVIYPIKFAVILFHEISHGIAAIVTGGSVTKIVVNSDLSGICATKGGIAVVVASAGYLGSLIFGSVLFISAYNRKISLRANVVIGIILIIFATNYFTETLAIIFAIVLAALIIVSAFFFPTAVHSYLMKSIGLISSLYVLIDIKEDLLTLAYRPSDAQILANLSGVPALIWGIIWLGISLGLVVFLFRLSYKKGLTK